MNKNTIQILKKLEDIELISPLFKDNDNFFMELKLINDDKNKSGWFKKVLNNIIQSYADDEIKIVFRGENMSEMTKKLYKKNRMNRKGGYEICELEYYHNLFHLGEKAKHCFKPKQTEIKKLNYLRHIKDVANPTFYFIFSRLNKILNINNQSLNYSPNQIAIMKDFRKKNRELTEYFKDPKNKKHFIGIVDKNSQLKENIRDYYIYLLHTFGDRGMRNLAFFVSTSEKFSKAKYFATTKFGKKMTRNV